MNLAADLPNRLLWLLNHSLQAGLLVPLVLLVQWLFRRHLTNRWRFALWWLVLLQRQRFNLSKNKISRAKLAGESEA